MTATKARTPIPATRRTAAGGRVTRQRSIVAEALGRGRVALSAQELHARIGAKHQRIGLATVYRALEAQVAAGTATRLERPGHVYVYAACTPKHHHHLVCASCQRVEDVAEEVVRPMLRAVRDKHGFQVDHAQLDLYGVCARCAGGRADQGKTSPTGARAQ